MKQSLISRDEEIEAAGYRWWHARLGVLGLGLVCQLCHLLTLWPLTGHFISKGPGFLISCSLWFQIHAPVRFSRMKWFVQSQPVNRCQSEDSNPMSSYYKISVLSTRLHYLILWSWALLENKGLEERLAGETMDLLWIQLEAHLLQFNWLSSEEKTVYLGCYLSSSLSGLQ